MDNEIKKLEDSILNEVSQCFDLFVAGLDLVSFNTNTKASTPYSPSLFIKDLVMECIKVSFFVSDKEIIRGLNKVFHNNYFQKSEDNSDSMAFLKSMAYEKIQNKYTGFRYIEPKFNSDYRLSYPSEQPSELDKKFKIEHIELMKKANKIEASLVAEFLPTKIGRKGFVMTPQYFLCYIDIIVQYSHARYNDWLKSITRKMGML